MVYALAMGRIVLKMRSVPEVRGRAENLFEVLKFSGSIKLYCEVFEEGLTGVGW